MNRILFLIAFLPLMCSAQTTSPEVIASSGDHFSNATGSLSWTLGETMTETFSNGGHILTQGFQQPVTVAISGINLALFAFLEGPFNGTEMNTTLNFGGHLPLNQPYYQLPWSYMGTEAVASIPNTDVVDWVLIELRDAPDAPSASSSTIIDRKAAFILNNGSIVATDGSSNLQFSNVTIQHSLFTVLWHRNHIGIMSAVPLLETDGVYSYDFTTGAGQVFGGMNAHKEIGSGIWGMTGADGNADGQINNGDKIDVWSPEAGSSGYLSGDFNLDSQVNNSDKNDIWIPNTGLGGQVPDTFDPQCYVPE